LRVQDGEFGGFLNWLHHADATLTFPQSVVMRYGVFEPERDLGVVADDYSRWFHARLRLLNNALEDGREFLVGGRFTLADVCVTYALFNASADGLGGGGPTTAVGVAEAQMVKPPLVADQSAYHSIVSPDAIATFVGPVEPE
jgi:glutathione S-transferase